MVQVICEKTGITFEATTRRTKNHPAIMAILSEASRYGWYADALTTLERGRAEGFTTIEQFVSALRDAESAWCGERDALIEKRNREKRNRDQAREEWIRLNNVLRARGYIWKNLGFASEEDADFTDFTVIEIGPEWHLYAPDGREVTVKQAMQELAL